MRIRLVSTGLENPGICALSAYPEAPVYSTAVLC